jgi:hypothetical protein
VFIIFKFWFFYLDKILTIPTVFAALLLEINRKITMYPLSFREKSYTKNISIKQACAVYYPRMLWNGRRNNPKAVQEYLESIEVEVFCQELESYPRKCVSNSGEKLRPTLSTKTTSLFDWHQPKHINILQ